MSALTFITLAVVAYGLLGKGGYGRALALGGATAAGSAIAVSGTAVPTFYAVALGTVVALVLKLLGNGRTPARAREPLPPGAALLILFLVWSTLVTLTAPLLFDGLAIVTPGATSLVAGVVTTSNIAQIVYLVVGVCVVVFLARSPSARPELIGIAVGTSILLSFWRYGSQLLGLPFPEGVFDNSPSFAYIERAAGDVPRFRGIMSEPSSLAGSALIAIAYMYTRAFQVRGWRRAGALIVAAIALYLGIISTSATFLVAGLAVAVIGAVSALTGFLARRTSLSRVISVIVCVLVIVALWVLPLVSAFVESAVNDKIASSSYDDRTEANTLSLGIFLDTFGFGVGVGSARASSFVPTLLSATGLVGTLLLTAVLVTLIFRSSDIGAYRPVIWALVTLMVVKIAAGPDLSDSTGIFWMSLGLLSHAVLERRESEAADTPQGLGDVAAGGRRS